MQLFINCQGETRCVQIGACATVEELAQQVQAEFGLGFVPALYSASGRLESLEGQVSDATLFAALALIGGGKKRGGKKRKAYTTPKKNKHKHKNVKLQALSYYAFDKDQVQRVKKLCTQDTCRDKGIFMANHWNRYYCGNCHLALEKLNAPKEEPKKTKVVATKADAAKEEAPAKKAAKKGK